MSECISILFILEANSVTYCIGSKSYTYDQHGLTKSMREMHVTWDMKMINASEEYVY